MNHAWLDQTEYPFQSHYFPINGQRLHFIDEGQGDSILFVHGTPSWSFDYRKVIKTLRTNHRCIAIDHIGFGLSDKPKVYDYSTLNHSHTLEKFILAQNLQNIILVVHDFGGPIGLNFAFKHPERVKGIVVLNSWLWSSETDADFLAIRKILKSPLLPILYRYFNFSPQFILPQSFGEQKLSRSLLRQYTRPFARIAEREGPLAFAHSLLNDQAWFESLWEQRNLLQNKPMLLLWGMKDQVIKPKHLDKFLEGFPYAISKQLPTAGHFPQEEQPDKVATMLQEFLISINDQTAKGI